MRQQKKYRHSVQLALFRAATGLIVGCYSLGLSDFALGAADILYDFGVQQYSPKVTSTNPALLDKCEVQTMTGFSIRKVAFELENLSSAQLNVNQDKDENYGSIDFGMCNRPLRWLSYGIHINANALSFRFETQNQNDPVIFPYGKDTLPIASGGIGIKLTEPFSIGFAWKMVERVNVASRVPVRGFELQAEIDVDVRPVASWLLGGSLRVLGQEFYYSYSPEIRGDLDFSFDIDIELPFIEYDIGLVQLQTAIAYVPAQNRFGVLGAWRGVEYDLGVVQNQWSKLDDPFLNVDAFGNIDVILFVRRQLQLQDTYEPYLVLRKQVSARDTLIAGYSFRRNPIKDSAVNEPLVGADLHSLKFGFESRFKILNKPIIIGGDLLYGFMNGAEATSPTQNLQGYFTNVQGFIRLPLE